MTLTRRPYGSTLAFLVDRAPSDVAEGIDATIAQEWPVAAHVFHPPPVAFDDQQFFRFVAGLLQYHAERIRHERPAPELEPAFGRALVADAVDRGDKNAVGDRVAALHRLPGVVLGYAELNLLAGVPANRGWVDQHFRPFERREAGSL